MEQEALTVHIDVPPQSVDPGMLERFARAMKELTGATGTPWAFTALRVGSLDTAARPVTASTSEVESALAGMAEGLAALEAGLVSLWLTWRNDRAAGEHP